MAMDASGMIDYITSIVPELVNAMPCAFGELQAVQNIRERWQAMLIKSNCDDLCSSVDFVKHCDVCQRQARPNRIKTRSGYSICSDTIFDS